ncbi:MAG TPA: hypothetical protein VFV18_06930, partial [Porticoccaceae bacterium]|nr:hypothetical protein [Porticoccaceae bacterium]
ERTFDSAAFVTALRLWHPALVQYDPTPRGVKRFANRARLMVLYERLSAAAEDPPRQPMAEEHVVAVTAIHQVEPELLHQWAERCSGSDVWAGFELDWPPSPPNVADATNTTPQLPLRESWRKHYERHGGPAAEEIVRLSRRMQDVKVR